MRGMRGMGVGMKGIDMGMQGMGVGMRRINDPDAMMQWSKPAVLFE